MRPCSMAAAFASLGVSYFAAAQAPAKMSAEITETYTAVKSNIAKAADRMPDADYGFRPMPDFPGFREVLIHIANEQMRACSAATGDPKSTAPVDKATKDDVIAILNQSFAECDKAYGFLNDANAGEVIKTLQGPRTRIGTLAANTAHDNEQYGILTVYLRLKEIAPPSDDRWVR